MTYHFRNSIKMLIISQLNQILTFCDISNLFWILNQYNQYNNPKIFITLSSQVHHWRFEKSGVTVAFGNDKSGTIVSIGKMGESPSCSIDNVYLVDGLQHNLLSVSQLCDKDNLVGFSPKQCLVINIKTGDVMLRGKQHKNVYKVSIVSLPQK